MTGTLQMLDKLNGLIILPVADALLEIEKLKNDPNANPRNLAAFLMGIDTERVKWGSKWDVPDAVLELMWYGRANASLQTLLYMLQAYMSESVVHLAYYELDLTHTVFANIMRELSLDDRVAAALYVLDEGQTRLDEGKDKIDEHLIGMPTYAMLANEFLSDEYARFPIEDLESVEKQAAYKVLGMGFEMIMSENETLTLSDLIGTIKLIFGTEVPNPQKLAKAA